MFIKRSKVEDIELVQEEDAVEFDHELTREKITTARALHVLQKRADSDKNKLEN